MSEGSEFLPQHGRRPHGGLLVHAWMLQMTLAWHKAPYLEQFELHFIYIYYRKRGAGPGHGFFELMTQWMKWHTSVISAADTNHGGPRCAQTHWRPRRASPCPCPHENRGLLVASSPKRRFPFAATPEKPSGLRSPGWLGRGEDVRTSSRGRRCSNAVEVRGATARPGAAQGAGRAAAAPFQRARREAAMGAVAWRWVLRVARFSGCGGGALAVLRRPPSSGARAASSSGSAVGEAGAARRGGAGGELVLASLGVGGIRRVLGSLPEQLFRNLHRRCSEVASVGAGFRAALAMGL